MEKPKIQITLIDRIGTHGCHRGHKIGDRFDYDTDRGKICPMVMHVAFPYIDIIRCGGTPPKTSNGEIRFCCPDADVINIFRIDIKSDAE